MIRIIIANKNWKYNMMFIGNKIGIVSNKKWNTYCDKIFNDLMASNEDVLVRLKMI